MKTVQTGAEVVRDFGEHGGILGLIIAALFAIVIMLLYLLWKNMNAINGNTIALTKLVGMLQSKPCLTRDSEARRTLNDAV